MPTSNFSTHTTNSIWHFQFAIFSTDYLRTHWSMVLPGKRFKCHNNKTNVNVPDIILSEFVLKYIFILLCSAFIVVENLLLLVIIIRNGGLFACESYGWYHRYDERAGRRESYIDNSKVCATETAWLFLKLLLICLRVFYISSLQKLQQTQFGLFTEMLHNTHNECRKWDDTLLELQKKIVSNGDAFLDNDYQIKVHCHVRFVDLPPPDPRYKQPFPTNDHIGQFIQLKANVVRITPPKLCELKREYGCAKCSTQIIVENEYLRSYIFDPPRACASCGGSLRQLETRPKAEFCIDYQEIRVQVGVHRLKKKLKLIFFFFFYRKWTQRKTFQPRWSSH